MSVLPSFTTTTQRRDGTGPDFWRFPGRTSTVVNDRIRRNTTVYMWSYISVSYTETYGGIRRKKRSFTVLVHEGCIQSPFSSVYDRIVPYTVTKIYDRNTITCITVVYGRIVNVYSRLRSYTELVTVDLGRYRYRSNSNRPVCKLFRNRFHV
jgi:hypothetical protein